MSRAPSAIAVAIVLVGLALAACDPALLEYDPPQTVTQPSSGIAGEWRLYAEDRPRSCRFVIDPGSKGQGRAKDYGCTGIDGFAGFIRRWEREDGQIYFFSRTRDGPVARVRRADRDTLRGRLIPSGRRIVLTRN